MRAARFGPCCLFREGVRGAGGTFQCADNQPCSRNFLLSTNRWVPRPRWNLGMGALAWESGQVRQSRTSVFSTPCAALPVVRLRPRLASKPSTIGRLHPLKGPPSSRLQKTCHCRILRHANRLLHGIPFATRQGRHRWDLLNNPPRRCIGVVFGRRNSINRPLRRVLHQRQRGLESVFESEASVLCVPHPLLSVFLSCIVSLCPTNKRKNKRKQPPQSYFVLSSLCGQ